MSSIYFERYASIALPHLGQPFLKAIKDNVALIIERTPIEGNSAFISMARALGNISLEGLKTDSHTLEDGCVHLVMRHPQPAEDPFGNLITSTTNLDFELHTDEFFSRAPARFVLLLCLSQPSVGGESLISLIDSIVPTLDDQTKSLLMEPVYPSQVGSVPILKKVENGYSVRFNELEMKRAELGKYAAACSAKHTQACKMFLNVAKNRAVQLKLQAGDCLILDNQKALHGRLGFSDNDFRLLKRLRVK